MDSNTLDILLEINRVLCLEGQAILACAEQLNSDEKAASQIQKAVLLLQKTLSQGGKIIVTGLGKSGKVAQKIAATLSSTGSLAVYLHPTEGLHGDIGLVTPQDAILALSHTGNTDEIVRLLPSLKNLHVPIIGIGGNPKSQLATQSDLWIHAAIEQEACPHNLAPTTSTTLALALGDALAVTLMKLRGFDSLAFAQNHPGGSLGKRLQLTVQHLMHQGDQVGTVKPNTSMDEVVVIATQKKLGAVLVVDQTKLLGIITDGDLRRALTHREKFFTLRAEDVMTRTPITASPEMMASEALTLMEHRSSQISVLPVVDSNGNWLGLLRLHDLLRTF